jgi:acyl-CoA thioesterase YciA
MQEQPQGQLVIRTIAMPADTNSNGDIFGGWLVSQMDLGASTLAQQRSQSRCVTVAINNLSFIRPVQVGDIVCCYADIVRMGRTSMTIDLTTWTYSDNLLRQQKVAIGTFVFVAIDKQGKPRLISP